jgi:hypothetical protein
MEGSVVDLGERAGRSQQLKNDLPPATSYSASDLLGVWQIDVRHDPTCPPTQPFAPRTLPDAGRPIEQAASLAQRVARR